MKRLNMLLAAAMLAFCASPLYAEAENDAEELHFAHKERLDSLSDFNEAKMLSLEAAIAKLNENYKEAAKKYHQASKVTQDSTRKAEFLLCEADCWLLANKTNLAAELYRDLVKHYALQLPFDHVVEQMRITAEKFAVGDGTFLSIKDRDAAIEMYFMLLTEAPAINVSLQDRLRLAELLVEDGREEEAVTTYQDVLKLDPSLHEVRLKLALLLVDLCKYGDGDGTIRRAAIRHATYIKEHCKDFPRMSEVTLILDDAREVEAERMLELGKFYLRPSHLKPSAAKMYLRDLTSKFPGTRAAWEGEELLANSPAFKTNDKPAADTAPKDTPQINEDK